MAAVRMGLGKKLCSLRRFTTLVKISFCVLLLITLEMRLCDAFDGQMQEIRLRGILGCGYNFGSSILAIFTLLYSLPVTNTNPLLGVSSSSATSSSSTMSINATGIIPGERLNSRNRDSKKHYNSSSYSASASAKDSGGILNLNKTLDFSPKPVVTGPSMRRNRTGRFRDSGRFDGFGHKKNLMSGRPRHYFGDRKSKSKNDRRGVHANEQDQIAESLRRRILKHLGNVDPLLCLPKALCGLSSRQRIRQKDQKNRLDPFGDETDGSWSGAEVDATTLSNGLKEDDYLEIVRYVLPKLLSKNGKKEEDWKNGGRKSKSKSGFNQEEGYSSEGSDEDDKSNYDNPFNDLTEDDIVYYKQKAQVENYMRDEQYDDGPPNWWDSFPQSNYYSHEPPPDDSFEGYYYLPAVKRITSLFGRILPSFAFGLGGSPKHIFGDDPFFTSFNGRSLNSWGPFGKSKSESSLSHTGAKDREIKNRKIKNRKLDSKKEGSLKTGKVRVNKQKYKARKVSVGLTKAQMDKVDDPTEKFELAVEIGKTLDDTKQCDYIFNGCPFSYEEIIAIIDQSSEVSQTKDDDNSSGSSDSGDDEKNGFNGQKSPVSNPKGSEQESDSESSEESVQEESLREDGNTLVSISPANPSPTSKATIKHALPSGEKFEISLKLSKDKQSTDKTSKKTLKKKKPTSNPTNKEKPDDYIVIKNSAMPDNSISKQSHRFRGGIDDPLNHLAEVETSPESPSKKVTSIASDTAIINDNKTYQVVKPSSSLTKDGSSIADSSSGSTNDSKNKPTKSRRRTSTKPTKKPQKKLQISTVDKHESPNLTTNYHYYTSSLPSFRFPFFNYNENKPPPLPPPVISTTAVPPNSHYYNNKYDQLNQYNPRPPYHHQSPVYFSNPNQYEQSAYYAGQGSSQQQGYSRPEYHSVPSKFHLLGPSYSADNGGFGNPQNMVGPTYAYQERNPEKLHKDKAQTFKKSPKDSKELPFSEKEYEASGTKPTASLAVQSPYQKQEASSEERIVIRIPESSNTNYFNLFHNLFGNLPFSAPVHGYDSSSSSSSNIASTSPIFTSSSSSSFPVGSYNNPASSSSPSFFSYILGKK